MAKFVNVQVSEFLTMNNLRHTLIGNGDLLFEIDRLVQ